MTKVCTPVMNSTGRPPSEQTGRVARNRVFERALWCVPPRALGPGENTLRFTGKRVGEHS